MSESRGYRRRLPAGIIDAGFASLATFAVGLTAVNLLGDTDRGLYAVFFTAYVLGMVFPMSLIFTPAEVRTVAFPVDARLALLPQSLLLGLGPAIVGASAVLMAVLATTSYASPGTTIAFALTAGLATILSPLQDHVRKMFHIAARSWHAATLSIVLFVTVVIAIAAMIALDVDAEWIPFGALSIANAVSILASRFIAAMLPLSAVPERFRFSVLASKGKWIVVQSAAPEVIGFAVAIVIAALASPEALGYAEAARVVATPVLVLAVGIKAVLSPRSIEAGMNRNRKMGRGLHHKYLAIIGVAGIGYIAVAGWDWVLNPMSYLVPAAYAVPGLVALTVVSNMTAASNFLQTSEMLGAHKEKTLARIAWTAGPVLLLGGLTAATTGAYARSLGRVGQTTTRYAMLAASLRGVYRSSSDAVGDSVHGEPAHVADSEKS